MSQSLAVTYEAIDGIDDVSITRELVNDQLLKTSVAVPDSTASQVIVAPLTRAKIKHLFICADQNLTLKTNGTDEVQRVSTTGTVTSGTFTLTYSAQTTAAINWNASAADVQSALIALSNIGPLDVVCSGGPLPATPVTITFQANLAATNVASITSTDSLTGGSTSMSTVTPGVAATDTFNLVANMPLDWDAEAAYFTNPLTADVTRWLVSNASGAAATLTFRVLSTS